VDSVLEQIDESTSLLVNIHASNITGTVVDGPPHAPHALAFNNANLPAQEITQRYLDAVPSSE